MPYQFLKVTNQKKGCASGNISPAFHKGNFPFFLKEESAKVLTFKDRGLFLGKGLKPEEAEIRRFRQELVDVKEDRDILKKALGVFSERSCDII